MTVCAGKGVQGKPCQGFPRESVAYRFKLLLFRCVEVLKFHLEVAFMVRQKCFCIYDEKAKAYLTPFFLPEVGMARRTFSDCVNDGAHAFGKHPADYTLFLCGSFDQSSGVFTAEVLSVVCNGVEVKE